MNTLLGAPKVLTDRFPVPVDVPLPDGGTTRIGRARVILTAPERDVEPRLLVFTSVEAPKHDLVWLPATSEAGDLHVPWRIATEHGNAVIHPGRGCRCGRLGHHTFYHPERRESLTKVLRQAREQAEAAS